MLTVSTPPEFNKGTGVYYVSGVWGEGGSGVWSVSGVEDVLVAIDSLDYAWATSVSVF